MRRVNLRKVSSTLALVMAGAVLAACGGGGGGSTTPTATSASPPPPPPPPPPSATTWQPGMFAAASTFKDQCANPRTGVDIENRPFPDQAGSLAEELFWLRSWTNETYLWNDEVIDRDPEAHVHDLFQLVLDLDIATDQHAFGNFQLDLAVRKAG